MATFYGSDTNCIDDLPLIDTQVTDPRVLIGQRLARRLTTPRGALGLINDDPNAGWDVRQYVNAKLIPQTLALAETEIRNECLKDEQVLVATVRLTQSPGAIAIRILVNASPGPFTLTMNVGQLTTELLVSF